MDAPVTRAPAVRRRLRGGPLLRLRSDEQLLALFRSGSDDAFDVLHDRYRPRLFTYTRQMLGGSPSDAEDALQDVFLRAYHALRADDRPVSVRAWLYRVAHNRCIDQIRRAKPPTLDIDDESRPETAAATGNPSLQDPVVVAARREELQTLVTDVTRLPEQQRSALLLREMEGLSYSELAVALECSVPAVKSLLVRARMGLVEQAEARALQCSDIRDDLDDAHDRGVRMPGRARRHIRDCQACSAYRSTLKGVCTDLGALMPAAGPWALWAKLAGLGGAGGGAAAATATGGAAAGGAAAGGGVALIGGGVTATAGKVAAIVCCAAVVGGGAVEVQEKLVTKPTPSPAKTERKAAVAREAPTVRASRPQPVAASAPVSRRAAPAAPKAEKKAPKPAEATSVVAPPAAGVVGSAPLVDPDVAAALDAGSLLAPDEPVVDVPAVTEGLLPGAGSSPGTGSGGGAGSSGSTSGDAAPTGSGSGASAPATSGTEGGGSSSSSSPSSSAAPSSSPGAGVSAPGPGGAAPAADSAG